MRITKDIELVPASNEILISKNDEQNRIQIENQLMQILVIMTEAGGSLVEKDVFIDRVWNGNSFTGDTALTKNIFKLRELIRANNIDDSLTIETIPKKGYRLLVKDAEVVKNKKPVPALPILILLLLATGILFLIFKNPSATNQPQMIVVGKDSIIQLDKNKVRVIDTDTLRAPVILEK